MPLIGHVRLIIRLPQIRCDRETPCAHCQHAGIECKSTSGLKPKEKRTRILITPQYEKKIDLIDRRLDGVVRLLEDLKLQLPSAATATVSAPSASAINPAPLPSKSVATSTSTPTSHANSVLASGPMVEGESSMTAQSIFAHEFLRKTVGDGPSVLEMRETLDALHSLVEALKQQPASHEMTYPHARHLPRPSLSDCEMPPVQSAVSVIREAKAQRVLGVQWVYNFLHMDHFTDLCLKVYFAPNEFNEAEFIIVNAGLQSLYMDMETIGTCTQQQKEEYHKMSRVCRGNLETALANLPLHLPATMDMIVALLFGSYHAVEVAKPSLAWTLNSAAAQLCQSLGYHRIASVRSGNRDDEDYKIFLFWSVYFVDKSLSLRLGRPSTIQDYDITVPYPSSASQMHGSLMSYFCLWVIVSGIQGKTYEQLYSPEAISQPALVREGRARGLAAELQRVTERTQETHAQYLKAAIDAVGQNTMDFFNVSDEVLRLSLLTIIYRAVPSPPGSPTTFSTECIDAARATLQRHQDCVEIMAKDGYYLFPMYMNWTILFAPFVPFIVIFCQVMETSESEDLARLQAFVDSIQAAKEFTEASARLYRLFQVLYNVALRYVELRNNSKRSEQAQATQEMDKYLAALGFPPSGLVGGADRQTAEVGNTEQIGSLGEEGMNPTGSGPLSQMLWMGNASQLEDWFYNNQQIMGLVEDDASLFQ
ncbi:fungal specific transcription factor domain-containing protein [Colletotrichum truncatum]|uniref:Fungal specific transcription factor domain-containing protein n=1 Tax=Colletotrichum truncatum TaxID=5467 RepID=A0ACC3ZIJ5_COLTU|nr:fungal specific transcription factor domain-containing protein [Colletotrichum truncatum]KAF6786715.1 fungal specific transcription factor domain-containing protein [Colletotrichum truncatum]